MAAIDMADFAVSDVSKYYIIRVNMKILPTIDSSDNFYFECADILMLGTQFLELKKNYLHQKFVFPFSFQFCLSALKNQFPDSLRVRKLTGLRLESIER